MKPAMRRKALRNLYDRVPKMVGCDGRCMESCGPIQCSTEERKVIEERAGRKLDTRDHPLVGPLTCTMLTPNGRCSVYGVRPMICRLFGAVPEMQCPFGCTPERELEPGEGLELMLESMKIGGGMDRAKADALKAIARAPEVIDTVRAMFAHGVERDGVRSGRINEIIYRKEHS